MSTGELVFRLLQTVITLFKEGKEWTFSTLSFQRIMKKRTLRRSSKTGIRLYGHMTAEVLRDL